MSAYETILYSVKGGVATVTLNRPESLNAYTATMGDELRDAVCAAARDQDVRVIVLTGAGRGFCAGADMKLLQKIAPAAPGERRAPEAASPQPDIGTHPGPSLGNRFDGRFGYFFKTGKPIIAALNGPTAGLGFVLALYADVRFAASEAKFTTSFSQRGLIAEHGISWLLPRLVGPSHALDLLLSARKFGAAEAERIGLVNKVLPQAGFMAEVMVYASALADTVSPRSTAVMKAQVWNALFEDYNEALAVADQEMQHSFASADFKEGVSHFVEKRAPRFTGR